MDGDNPDGLLLGASGASEVSLPTNIVFANLFDMVQAARGVLPLVLVETWIATDHLPVTENSTSETNQDAEVAYLLTMRMAIFQRCASPSFVEQVASQRFELERNHVGFAMDVDNEHASNLIFNRFAYDLSLGGASTLSGVVDDLEEVIHGGDADVDTPNQKVRLPITDSLSVIGSFGIYCATVSV